MDTWRLIRSGLQSPAYNMALDEAIVQAHSEGKVPPTLRFYGWSPPTLSIGYFQKADEVNLAAVEAEGFGFVRRPTGGRAVLHDKELTYSIIVTESYPGLPSGVTEAYRVLSEGLRIGFSQLGLNAQMVQGAEPGGTRSANDAASAACFDAPSWYELVVEGRKVAGSAQLRQKGVVLQHGSILLELDVSQLFDLLKFPNPAVRQRMEKSFHSKAVAINLLRRELGLSSVTFDEAELAFQQGFAEGMGVQLELSEPTDYEKRLADQLLSEKYASSEWNLRK
jgi:lipoyl(octanoyl) transferase